MPLNVDQLLAVLPHPVLTKIFGEPNLASITLQQSEHNGNLEVGFSDNLGEYRVRDYRQELVGIERHLSNLSNWLYRVGAACS